MYAVSTNSFSIDSPMPALDSSFLVQVSVAARFYSLGEIQEKKAHDSNPRKTCMKTITYLAVEETAFSLEWEFALRVYSTVVQIWTR